MEEEMHRAQHEYMTRQTDCTWEQARERWESLSVEIQATLIHISNTRMQQVHDISQGLLATLHMYQGAKDVKASFANAIMTCTDLLLD